MRSPRDARLLGVVVGLALMGAASNDPADRLRDPAQESRARSLFRDIRCLICQNQSIDESDADLAEDLRKIVRAQVSQGRSNAQIKQYIVDRYGEFALERPVFSLSNAFLWGGPFAVLLGGLGVLVLRRRPSLVEEAPLSVEEETKLTDISSKLS